MKIIKKFIIVFFAIFLFAGSMFFLFFRKNPEENEIKNEEKNIQKSEAENEKKQLDSDADSAEEIPEDMHESFGRGGERYTEKAAVYKKNMGIVSLDSVDVCKEIGCDPYILKEYLVAFARKQKIICKSGKILDYCYAEMPDATRKIYIFIQLDDSKQTLAAAVFEPATTDEAAYYDVLPCWYSLQEIEGQAWYEKEEQ